jgi:hypothetical protein
MVSPENAYVRAYHCYGVDHPTLTVQTADCAVKQKGFK